MYRADGVRHGALCMFFVFQNGFNGNFQIARVIHRVKYTEYIYAIDSGSFNKFTDNIISIMTIAE